MVVKELEVMAKGDLVVDRETLKQAGLGERLRLVIQEGEIRILPETPSDPERMLDDLAGCLGQEPATEYNFDLKIGGLYEARYGTLLARKTISRRRDAHGRCEISTLVAVAFTSSPG